MTNNQYQMLCDSLSEMRADYQKLLFDTPCGCIHSIRGSKTCWRCLEMRILNNQIKEIEEVTKQC
jgi:hypothetical protein